MRGGGCLFSSKGSASVSEREQAYIAVLARNHWQSKPTISSVAIAVGCVLTIILLRHSAERGGGAHHEHGDAISFQLGLDNGGVCSPVSRLAHEWVFTRRHLRWGRHSGKVGERVCERRTGDRVCPASGILWQRHTRARSSANFGLCSSWSLYCSRNAPSACGTQAISIPLAYLSSVRIDCGRAAYDGVVPTCAGGR